MSQAYRVACHYGDSEEQVEESMRIASSAVYNKLMLFVLVSGWVGGGRWAVGGGRWAVGGGWGHAWKGGLRANSKDEGMGAYRLAAHACMECPCWQLS